MAERFKPSQDPDDYENRKKRRKSLIKTITVVVVSILGTLGIAEFDVIRDAICSTAEVKPEPDPMFPPPPPGVDNPDTEFPDLSDELPDFDQAYVFDESLGLGIVGGDPKPGEPVINLAEAARAAERAAEPDAWKEPEAIIEGPSEADAGRLITLDASGAIGDALQWDPINLPNPTDYEICGRKLFFTSNRPGLIEVRLWVASSKDGIPVFDGAIHRIRISGELPDPPVEPPVTPPDEPGKPPVTPPEDDEPDIPEIPDGRFRLAHAAYWQTVKVPQGVIGRARDVARVYREKAENPFSDAQKLADATAEGIRNELAGDVDGWREWYAAITAQLDKLESAGKIQSMTDWRDAWREIATGLEAVK